MSMAPMVTLKFRLRVTHRTWNHWIDHTQLFDSEYYRDLETWVRGHSRSLKMVYLIDHIRLSIGPPL